MRLALLLPLWLVFAIGEPSLVHQCPMHDVASTQGTAIDPHATHAEHAEHAEHAPADRPAPHSHQCCSCIGACTAASSVVAPRPAAIPAALIALGEPLAPATVVQSVRVEAHRVLPYANGPPAQRG